MYAKKNVANFTIEENTHKLCIYKGYFTQSEEYRISDIPSPAQ